jgi:hypothetical protein
MINIVVNVRSNIIKIVSIVAIVRWNITTFIVVNVRSNILKTTSIVVSVNKLIIKHKHIVANVI